MLPRKEMHEGNFDEEWKSDLCCALQQRLWGTCVRRLQISETLYNFLKKLLFIFTMRSTAFYVFMNEDSHIMKYAAAK